MKNYLWFQILGYRSLRLIFLGYLLERNYLMNKKMTSQELAQYIKSEALKMLNSQMLSEGVKDIIAQEGMPTYESQTKLQPYDVAFRGLFLNNIRKVKCDYKAAWDNMMDYFEEKSPEKLKDKEFMKGLMKTFSEYVGGELYSKLNDRFENNIAKMAQKHAVEMAEANNAAKEPVKKTAVKPTAKGKPDGGKTTMGYQK